MEQVMNYLPWIGVAIVVVVLVLLVRWILSLRRVVKPSEVHVVRRSNVPLEKALLLLSICS